MRFLFMKRLICYILFICCCAFNTWAQTYDDFVEKSLNAIEADSLLAAENYIRQAIEAEPDNPINAMLLSNLGTIQRRRQQYEQALITDRNLAMADFAENVLRSGKKVFVCVGAFL